MKTPHAIIAFVILARLSCTSHCLATGYYGPNEYLGNGGSRLTATPEFYWELEVKRLAKDFHPTEKLSKIPPSGDAYEKKDITPLKKATSDADIADFADALKTKAISPPDSASAIQEHQAARDFISQATDKTTNALPGEFDSEFSDYHKGAAAFALGKNHWEEARKAWEGLLQRPSAERHYRSVWAAFMLGKLALKNNDPAAVKWFQMTRDLVKQGFADSLGMAADSYGWEGRSEWKQGHPEKAAPLYMTQLALGDQSAIVSLKALIPDRVPVDGMLNYGPEDDVCRFWNNEQRKAADDKALQELKTAATDPLLRRLITAHILSAGAQSTYYADSAPQNSKRALRWLSVINDAHISTMEDAEYLGWLAYTTGNYKEADRWLKLAEADTPASCWLRSKLELREGKLDAALKDMSQAYDSLKTTYTSLNPSSTLNNSTETEWFVYSGDGGDWQFSDYASGDLGQFHLTRGDFIQSLDTFFQGGLWDDTAFVAERVLTTDELKLYVDKLASKSSSGTSISHDQFQRLRNLLGRRLVRNGHYQEAGAYLTPPYGKILEVYAKALRDGKNEKLSNRERAEAYFKAAWIARYSGLELMGTEVSPDGFDSGGAFENTDIAQQRLSGKYVQSSYENGHETNRTISIFPKPSKWERLRLEQNQIQPDVRYHYRLIAVDLALKASKLLDNNTVELADVLNTAGNWIKNRDEKLGNRIENLLENRCPNTAIGKSAIAKHWFVTTLGPWSQAQKESLDALNKELNIQPPDY